MDASKKRLKALVLAPEPFFTPRGTPFSVYYRTLVMAQLGVEVDLVTYGEGEDVEIEGVTIYRTPRFRLLGSVRAGPSLLKLWLDIFVFLRTLGLLLRNRYDFVDAHEESVFFARYLKPIFRFKLVYDMHSSLPEQLVNFDFTRSRLLIRLFELLERTSLVNSDVVITVTPGVGDYASSLVDSSQVLVIENSIFDDVRLSHPVANHDRDPSQVLPAQRTIVAYAGTFEPYQGIDVLMRAHAVVVRERPDAFLLLIGGTPRQVDECRSLAAELGIEDDCLLMGTLPQPLTRRYLKQASVLVSPRLTGGNIPMKIYEQLASGIPLVATRVPSHTQVLNDAVSVLTSADPEGFAEGILAVLRDPRWGQEVADRARELYERAYGWDAYVLKMRDLLEILTSCAE